MYNKIHLLLHTSSRGLHLKNKCIRLKTLELVFLWLLKKKVTALPNMLISFQRHLK